MNQFGMTHARDSLVGCASALTYWVFRCRDRKKSPAMGTSTWTYLEKSIQNSAEIAQSLEVFLQTLSDKLIAHLRPSELHWVVQPTEKIVRFNRVTKEIIEADSDQLLPDYSWRDMLFALEHEGYSEYDLLETFRRLPSMIQVIVRLRFEQDRVLGKEDVLEAIDVEVSHV